jgi:hypothetical protein
LALDSYTNQLAAVTDQKTWERVLKMISSREMPPANKPQPSDRERMALTKWIEKDVFYCDCERPDPGRVTIRRLNRAEYNNTIRDLLGVEFHAADDFPVDDSGYGFDNIADALSLSPLLVEKYLNAAGKVLDAALLAGSHSQRRTNLYSIDALEIGYNAKQQGDGTVALNSIEEDDVAINVEVPWAIEYAVRIKAYARQETNAPIQLTFLLDKTPIKVVNVETNRESPQLYEAVIKVPPGKHRIRAAVRRNKEGLSEAKALDWKSGNNQKGAVYVDHLEVDGPLSPPAASVGRNLLVLPSEHQADSLNADSTRSARDFLERFASRAYRRPIPRDESERLLQLVQSAWKRGDGFHEGLRLALEAILVSPHFLFRGEISVASGNHKSIQAVNEFALASRLSYFLWSSMPDEELFREATRGTLRGNLEKQVRRMLGDVKSRALVDNFAGQWLQFRNLELATPDPNMFPQFDETLRQAMRRETELFFEGVIREDRNILEFLTADYTFVNERLARHYGIDGIKGNEFQRVTLAGKPRKGILTHAGILTLVSNPTRTSPVKRGKWVLETLLNSPPPPPPPNVPELKEEKTLSGTLRQRMEQHRAKPLCASCHERMDPIGFSLENFDAIGAWREKDGKFPIDSTGELITGEKFTSATELLDVLAQKKRSEFVRCVAEKLLTYALGRGLEFQDKCAIDQITAGLAARNYRFSALVLEIARSTPFQFYRGQGLERKSNQ